MDPPQLIPELCAKLPICKCPTRHDHRQDAKRLTALKALKLQSHLPEMDSLPTQHAIHSLLPQRSMRGLQFEEGSVAANIATVLPGQ